MSNMTKEIVTEGGYYSSPNFVGIQDLFSEGLFLQQPINNIDGFDLNIYFQKILYALLAAKGWYMTPNQYPVVM